MFNGQWPSNYRTTIFLNANMDELAINLNLRRVYEGVFEQDPPDTLLDLDIYFNNEKIHEFDKSLDQSKFYKKITNFPEDKCCILQFVMNNKTHEHTKVDNKGNIIGDCRIEISNLTFDNVVLGQILVDNAVYLHSKNINTAQVEKTKFYGEMGCNGTVELKFYTPIYLWLLEHM